MEAEMHSRRSMLSIFGLCGMMCLAVAGPALGAEDRFDGVYTGKATLTKGSNPTCVAYDDVFIAIHGKTLKFTNSKLPNFIIGFYPRKDGSFRQNHVYNRQGSFVNIQGHVTGDLIEADVTNRPCEHHWHLTKVYRGQ